jgi:hypothetical protein
VKWPYLSEPPSEQGEKVPRFAMYSNMVSDRCQKAIHPVSKSGLAVWIIPDQHFEAKNLYS